MPIQLTLADVRQSDFPRVLGYCQNDFAPIRNAVNSVIQRLLYAGGENGFVNCWKRVVFQVDPTNPYITLPRNFARIINLSACTTPFRLHNVFYELLPGSIGAQPANCSDWCGSIAGYERQTVPTMVEMTSTNQKLRVYLTDTRDAGKRILITGLDQNGNQFFSQDGRQNVTGIYLTIQDPFATTSSIVTEIQFLQKDATYGDIILKQVDATTDVEVLLSRYGPTETNPKYRRYLINQLPGNCCVNEDTGMVAITAVVKLEFVPVYTDTDQLIISNIEALIEEAQALRYSRMDTAEAAGLERKHHMKAIRLLQDEQRHIEGEQEIAVSVNSFEGESMRCNAIGTLI